MPINQIQNGEAGLQVRTSLNQAIDYINAGSSSYSATASYAASASYLIGAPNIPFSQNRTTTTTSSIVEYQTIFNPSNLLVQDSNIFIVEPNAEYYVLNDLVNSGSLQVDGTLQVGGALINLGSITGTGSIL